MPEGIVVGGWQFIVPAYLITTLVLVAYVWSIFARRKRLENREGSDD